MCIFVCIKLYEFKNGYMQMFNIVIKIYHRITLF